MPSRCMNNSSKDKIGKSGQFDSWKMMKGRRYRSFAEEALLLMNHLVGSHQAYSHPASYASRLMMLHRNVRSDQLLKHQSSSRSLPHQLASRGPMSLPACVACTQPRAEFVDRHYHIMTPHYYTMARSVQLRHDASIMSLSTSVQLSWTGLSCIRAAHPSVSLK
jgi:hypothetical protein